jgi:hypothetical protein
MQLSTANLPIDLKAVKKYMETKFAQQKLKKQNGPQASPKEPTK